MFIGPNHIDCHRYSDCFLVEGRRKISNPAQGATSQRCAISTFRVLIGTNGFCNHAVVLETDVALVLLLLFLLLLILLLLPLQPRRRETPLGAGKERMVLVWCYGGTNAKLP